MENGNIKQNSITGPAASFVWFNTKRVVMAGAHNFTEKPRQRGGDAGTGAKMMILPYGAFSSDADSSC